MAVTKRNNASNGRWQTESGGQSSPAFRVFGFLLLAANVAIGICSFFVGAPVNGVLMFVVALFVLWTVWDDARDRC